jgi:hypothetical protein
VLMPRTARSIVKHGTGCSERYRHTPKTAQSSDSDAADHKSIYSHRAETGRGGCSRGTIDVALIQVRTREGFPYLV